jgi:hypothetical protein
MSIRHAHASGYAAALAHYKVANLTAGAAAYNPTLGGGPMNAAQSPAVAQPMAIPKPSTPTTAPVASGASKANVIG